MTRRAPPIPKGARTVPEKAKHRNIIREVPEPPSLEWKEGAVRLLASITVPGIAPRNNRSRNPFRLRLLSDSSHSFRPNNARPVTPRGSRGHAPMEQGGTRAALCPSSFALDHSTLLRFLVEFDTATGTAIAAATKPPIRIGWASNPKNGPGCIWPRTVSPLVTSSTPG